MDTGSLEYWLWSRGTWIPMLARDSEEYRRVYTLTLGPNSDKSITFIQPIEKRVANGHH